MKKYFCVIILALALFSTTSQGQIRGYGILMGAVSANQDWNYQSGFKLDLLNRWGANAGFYVEWLSMPVVSVLTEIHYTELGDAQKLPISTAEFPEGTGDFVRYETQVDYLSIPVLVKARMELETSEMYLAVGPRFDVKIRAQGSWPVTDHFRDVSYGPTFGGGVLFRNLLTSSGVGMEYRYCPTFGVEYSTPTLDVKSRSMEFLLHIGM
jgi:hypothetical protein